MACHRRHIDFLADSNSYLVWNNRLFVHGGYNPSQPIEHQHIDTLTWDRKLFMNASQQHEYDASYKFGIYDEIFIGHTTTQSIDSDLPLHMCNVWALDTGAGWTGKLTLMNVETHEYWQSDLAEQLYPGVQSAH